MGISTSPAISILYDTGTGQAVRQEGTATGQTEVVVTGSAAGEELAIKARQPELLDGVPLGDTFATPTRQVGSVDVVIVSAPAQAIAVDPGAGSGVPVRTTLDDKTEGSPSRLMTSLGLGALGEGAPGHLGTLAYPISVHGADTEGGLQQLGLDHTREDDFHAARLTDGAAFYDARQVRALTAADVVTAEQGTAAALAGAWSVKLTDATQLLTLYTTGPDQSAIAVPVRQVAHGSGRPFYTIIAHNVTLNPGNRSLLAMQNASLLTVRIVGVKIQNAQFTNVSGAIGRFDVRRGTGGVTGGAPASVVGGPRASSFGALNVGITWVTGGTLTSPVVVGSRRLSYDDVAVSSTDASVHQFGLATFSNTFDFHDSPAVVLPSESADFFMVTATTVGQFDIHFLLET